MAKKSSSGKDGYGNFVTPLDAKLPSGDPRFPVNNPRVLTASDPLGFVPGGSKSSSRGTKK